MWACAAARTRGRARRASASRSRRCSASSRPPSTRSRTRRRRRSSTGWAASASSTSGDASHQLHATRLVCGDRQLARRFLRSFALGQTLEGYFLDCWPAYDRLNRLAQRQVGAARWGPLLDHGVSFVADAWHHYQETGDERPADRALSALRPLCRYLLDRRGKDGLLPVEGWGVPRVWIDDGFERPATSSALSTCSRPPCSSARSRRSPRSRETRPGRSATRRRPTRSRPPPWPASGAGSVRSS